MSDKAFAIAMANTIPKGPKGDKGDPGDVSSVNEKTGAVVLDAGDLEYDSSETYTSGTVGAEISNALSDILQIENAYMTDVETEISDFATGNGYVWSGKVSSTTTASWVQHLYSVDKGDTISIKATVTEQSNVPAIVFTTEWVGGNSATTIVSDFSGNVSETFVAPANGVIAVLYTVNGVAKATNISISTVTEEYIDFQGEIEGINSKIEPFQMPTVKTVKKDGTGDFSTLRSALEYCMNNPEESGYEIQLYSGTYSLSDEYTTEELNAMEYDASDMSVTCGFMVTDGITLKGIGTRESVVISGELDTEAFTQAQRLEISPLNIGGNVTIENITAIMDNIRYTVHDDFTQSAGKTHVFKDCTFIAKHSANGLSNGSAWGAGTRNGERVVFDNCVLYGTVGYHKADGMTISDTVMFKNSRIEYGINLIDASSGVDGYLYLMNCYFNNITHTLSGDAQHINVIGVGEADYLLFAPATVIYCTGNVVRRTPNTGVAAGKCCKRGTANSFQLANNVDVSTNVFYGICVGIKDGYAYIQTSGTVDSNHLGSTDTTGWSVGDYLKIGSDSLLTVTANHDEAVAKVEYKLDDVCFAKILA